MTDEFTTTREGSVQQRLKEFEFDAERSRRPACTFRLGQQSATLLT
jgi:hypothetical protein